MCVAGAASTVAGGASTFVGDCTGDNTSDKLDVPAADGVSNAGCAFTAVSGGISNARGASLAGSASIVGGDSSVDRNCAEHLVSAISGGCAVGGASTADGDSDVGSDCTGGDALARGDISNAVDGCAADAVTLRSRSVSLLLLLPLLHFAFALRTTLPP